MKSTHKNMPWLLIVAMCVSLVFMSIYLWGDNQEALAQSNDKMEAKISEIAHRQDGSISIILTLSNTGKTQIYSEGEVKNRTIKLNGGMEARINWVGRNSTKESITISLVLSNKGASTIYLAHVGPASAQDNAGNNYDCRLESGLHDDRNFFHDNKVRTESLRPMTKIEPETDSAIGFTCKGKGKGPVMSFSTSFACRNVSDPIKDETVSEEQKTKGAYRMNFSFSSVSVTDAE